MVLFSPMENELFERKIKKLQMLLDEVEAHLLELAETQEELLMSLKPSLSLRVLQGGGEVGGEPEKRPNLMAVYDLIEDRGASQPLADTGGVSG